MFNFIFFYSSSKFYVNWEAYGCGWREAPQQCVTGVLWCSRLFIKCCSSRLNTGWSARFQWLLFRKVLLWGCSSELEY